MCVCVCEEWFFKRESLHSSSCCCYSTLVPFFPYTHTHTHTQIRELSLGLYRLVIYPGCVGKLAYYTLNIAIINHDAFTFLNHSYNLNKTKKLLPVFVLRAHHHHQRELIHAISTGCGARSALHSAHNNRLLRFGVFFAFSTIHKHGISFSDIWKLDSR